MSLIRAQGCPDLESAREVHEAHDGPDETPGRHHWAEEIARRPAPSRP
ncbi:MULTISPECIES: hypothetical protein [Actinoalloteichus]|uniref:Uncharacterized protein n=1 Tax=Actinoalloteichus fjordicus TaxID=1612552 RepID=A0AAC9LGI3_9PSEU|nr:MULTISPECIES: hypothetical protein [Actinoalloteichus]APU16322.1 hypothetical protein UA74_21485 [Actinoalloteichus fjordicus]APU22381.1 hypothetical protein UA75_21960 [Actinoalloteichus sp. GBA129-24]